MPANEAVLALDYGASRIGLAIARLDVGLAQPLGVIEVAPGDIFSQLEVVIEREAVSQLVVGYPRGADGQATQQTAAAERFMEHLKEHFKLPVMAQDESLTSVAAEAELNQRKADYSKADVDALAATYILEDWLKVHFKNGRAR